MNYKYPVSKPSLLGNELKYVTDAVSNGWISSQGDYVKRFEESWAKYNGVNYGVACSSGTTALVLALRAIGIKEGDEVIVPNFTMIATAWAVTQAGGTPVFVDCGLDLNINVDKIEEKITKKTVAIVPVHIYGRQCNMDKIMEIAYEYGLRVIEDSAEAHGVKPRGDIACFSLFANKIITSGEGGICVTNDKYLAEQMAHLRGMAFNKNHTFLHKKIGYNFRMTNLQAAVALAQVERIDEIIAKRKQIETWYDENLAELQGSTFNIMPKRNVLWMYDIKVAMRDRDALQAFLSDRGIETRVYFKAMTVQPMYADFTEAQYCWKVSLEGLYLPTYTDMTESDVIEICSALKDFYVKKDTDEKLKEEVKN